MKSSFICVLISRGLCLVLYQGFVALKDNNDGVCDQTSVPEQESGRDRFHHRYPITAQILIPIFLMRTNKSSGSYIAP